ncbi:hypothetical protein EV360DRAFT_76139 [Lentinula raphanica]|nr:hypothetical protein EV360DRAFT_76139 [Lentinula raphanica]
MKTRSIATPLPSPNNHRLPLLVKDKKAQLLKLKIQSHSLAFVFPERRTENSAIIRIPLAACCSPLSVKDKPEPTNPASGSTGEEATILLPFRVLTQGQRCEPISGKTPLVHSHYEAGLEHHILTKLRPLLKPEYADATINIHYAIDSEGHDPHPTSVNNLNGGLQELVYDMEFFPSTSVYFRTEFMGFATLTIPHNPHDPTRPLDRAESEMVVHIQIIGINPRDGLVTMSPSRRAMVFIGPNYDLQFSNPDPHDPSSRDKVGKVEVKCRIGSWFWEGRGRGRWEEKEAGGPGRLSEGQEKWLGMSYYCTPQPLPLEKL